MSQQSDTETPHNHIPYEAHTPQTYTNQHDPSQATTNFNKSVVEFFRCQMELTHSAQLLHQQTRDALNNIAKTSSIQENLHFINDIPILKVKDPQSFNEWLEQIDKVATVMNKDPRKLTHAKSQGLFSRIISSCVSTMGWNKIEE